MIYPHGVVEGEMRPGLPAEGIRAKLADPPYMAEMLSQ